MNFNRSVGESLHDTYNCKYRRDTWDIYKMQGLNASKFTKEYSIVWENGNIICTSIVYETL